MRGHFHEERAIAAAEVDFQRSITVKKALDQTKLD